MIKTTSLVALIGVVEVLKVGKQIIDASRYTIRQRPSGYTVQYSLCILSYVFHFPDSPEYWKRSLLINREMRINEWDSRF